MDNITNIILAAPLEYIEAAQRTGLSVAHMIYRIGRGYHLFRAQGSEAVRNGLMVVDTDGYTGGGPLNSLVMEILGECEKNSFSGIVLDTGGVSTRPVAALSWHMAAEASKHGVKLYVPEVLSTAGEEAIVLVPTALSGGTLTGHISDAIARYGKGRVALEIERVRMDFTPPVTNGVGKELSAEELQALIEQHHPQSFLSKELCAYYFTYRDKKGTHFVLFDNGASIKRKLQVAAKMGIDSAFLFCPHVADIIDKIII